MSWLFRVRPVTTLAPMRRAAAAPSWGGFTGTHWLTSDGLAGSYADAATNAAARVVFPGASIGTFTFAGWIRNLSGVGPFAGDTSDSQPSISFYDDGNIEIDLTDTTMVIGTITGGATPIASWTHVALVCDGSTLAYYENGVATGTPITISGTYAAADSLQLTRSLNACDTRSPAIWSSALSAGQVAALYALGVAGDPRTIASGPVHWWPADGDSGTTITDRGSAGTCNLTLHGGVTIGS